MASAREAQLVQTFVELADTLVNDFDVVDFLHLLVRSATEGLDAAEAGLLLADQDGTLHLMASSSERTRALELFQLQNEEGPCLECFHSGVPLTIENLEVEAGRWPRFVPAARDAGFAAVHAMPMRLRDQRIGVLNLFGANPGTLTDAQVLVSRAMADIATIGILQQRAIHEAQVTVDQLQVALNSRIMIEQAKGMLAERAGIAMEESFERLRTHARRSSRRLSDLAQDLIAGNLAPEVLRTLGVEIPAPRVAD
jgi:GAF domain-containing protein